MSTADDNRSEDVLQKLPVDYHFECFIDEQKKKKKQLENKDSTNGTTRLMDLLGIRVARHSDAECYEMYPVLIESKTNSLEHRRFRMLC